jgi:hypothetical protein
MNTMVLTTVAGDLTIMWRRFAVEITVTAATIVQPGKAATLRVLTGPRLLPTRFRRFRRACGLVARDRVRDRQGDNFLPYSLSCC